MFDESVLVGFNKRALAIDIVKTLYHKVLKPSDALFLGLTLPQWERAYRDGVRACQFEADRKSTRLNSSHSQQSRMPSSA